MPDELDAVQERIDADNERAVASARARTAGRLEGESAQVCPCGETIPEARRAALPGVRLCVECQDRVERYR